jgi:hypothetical protein
MAEAVGRINNYLPLFPNATIDTKFSNADIVEHLEWSIPQKWRTKFNLEGYVLTLFDKTRLVTVCEGLKCNEPASKQVKSLPLRRQRTPLSLNGMQEKATGLFIFTVRNTVRTRHM